MEGRVEGLLNLLGLPFAKQAVVHEHADQLITNRPVDQGSRDGGVDPSG